MIDTVPNDQVHEPQQDTWVAYMDILGYKEKVWAAERDGRLPELLGTIRQAMDEAIGPPEDNREWEVRVFSDTMIIGLRKHPALDVMLLLHRLIFLQSDLARHGLLLRGAVADGWYRDDGQVIVSPALVKAYEAEASLAVYPRVVLTDEIRQQVVQCAEEDGPACGHEEAFLEWDAIWLDNDGQAFLNYLSVVDNYQYPHEMLGLIRAHKELVERELAGCSDSPRILAKLYWLAAYHDRFCCQRLDEEMRQGYLINVHATLKPWSADVPAAITRDSLERWRREFEG